MNLAQSLEDGGGFATVTPKALCRLIRHTANVLDRSLADTPHDQLANVNYFLCSIAQHLRFVERSRTVNTPWSMIQATEHFLRQQVGANSRFIIRPQWAHNYSLTGEFVEAYRTEIASMAWIDPKAWEESSAERPVDERVYCIAFPRVERLNALLHANWGHELGHIVAARWIHGRFGQLWNGEEPDMKARIRQTVEQGLGASMNQALFKDLIINQYVSEYTDSAMELARDGLTELICDAIGVHLLGPSALAACLEFSAGFSLDENPLRCDRYPPWRYRLRLMLEACQENEDFLEEEATTSPKAAVYPGETVAPFWEWLREAKRLVTQTPDLQMLHRDGMDNVSVREAYTLVENHWRRIRGEALDMLLGGAKRPYKLRERLTTIDDLVAKLENDIPPNEVDTWPDSSPAAFEDIINAAWVFKARKLAQDPEWGCPKDLERLYRLVLKAIEASFVHSVFGPRLARLDKP